MPEPEYDGLLALERMERAVEKVRDRLLRSTAALEAAGIPYDITDERTLETDGKMENGRIKLGQATYEHVVVDPAAILRGNWVERVAPNAFSSLLAA